MAKTSLQNYLSPQAYQLLQAEKLKRIAEAKEFEVYRRVLHEEQQRIKNDPAKRKIVRAGRRGGKTVLAADIAIEKFFKGRRILYATPTQEQIDTFWYEVNWSLVDKIESGELYKNETRHIIEVPGTRQRIRAKTAWDADSLRGDYADELILDEFQLMKQNAWDEVGAPMLLDNDGNAILIYTKKRGKNFSNELFKQAQEDETGRWKTFVFSSHANPYISKEALNTITQDMTQLAYRAEILAEDVEDDPRALWKREDIEASRRNTFPDLVRIVVGVDPQSTTGQTGIIVAGCAKIGEDEHYFVLEDATPESGVSPEQWGSSVVAAYNHNNADRIIGEVNHGGDMVENVIRNVEGGSGVSYSSVRASRGKAVRAEPVSALYERGLVHHIGKFDELEDEMCNWVPGESSWSPNRIDALVWAITALKSEKEPEFQIQQLTVEM